MASATVEHLIRQIETLDPSDRVELRRRLDSTSSQSKRDELDEAAREKAFLEHLRRKGMILEVPPVDDALFPEIDVPDPVEVKGEPVSVTLIRERR